MSFNPSGASAAADAYPAISDYAIIGDCRTAALIARSGAIEWLCLPSFSSPSFFASILDRRKGGFFSIAPTGAYRSARRYVDDTAVIETTFSTETGEARVVDFMPIENGDHPWATKLGPQRQLVRLIEGLSGGVDLAIEIEPRPDYGRGSARVSRRRGFGWAFACKGGVLCVASDVALTANPGGDGLSGVVSLKPGETCAISLGFSETEIAVRPAIGEAALALRRTTEDWWRGWTAQCVYRGAARPLVLRSAITLKLMTYALSGAVVAAPTTSLPEAIGAGRNWDYRFCWLRDASVTMDAFLGLGLQNEASAFLRWMLHSTRLTRPELRILYDVHGRNDAREETLDHLNGYMGSKPVRIGNAAGSQLQLDTYGSVVLAAYGYMERQDMLAADELRLLRDFGEVVCKRWREPDHGMWEIRGTPRHFTATKVMCWAALDRLIRLGERGAVTIPLERFRQNREALRATIETRGYNEEIGSYVAELDGEAMLDASVLLMGMTGFGDPRRDRLIATARRLADALSEQNLYRRYQDGFDHDASREGTFGICSAWAADLFARQGDLASARRVFASLAATANDVGLFAEEYDPATGVSLGNFPQAFTHAGVIAAALSIAAAERESDAA